MLPSARVKAMPRLGSGGIARQRMNKNGNYSGDSTGQPTTGWTSDSTYPAIINNNRLQVVGSGPATVSATMNVSTNGAAVTITLRHNGTVVATVTWTDPSNNVIKTFSANRTVAAGDLIDILVTTRFHTINASGTYVEVYA